MMMRRSDAAVHLEPLLVALDVLLRYTGVDLVNGLQATTKVDTVLLPDSSATWPCCTATSIWWRHAVGVAADSCKQALSCYDSSHSTSGAKATIPAIWDVLIDLSVLDLLCCVTPSAPSQPVIGSPQGQDCRCNPKTLHSASLEDMNPPG
jgi:hypothetical protein